MRSWGVEVKPGQSLHVSIGEGKCLYLTQASLGETKKETQTTESIFLFKTVDNKKHLLGTLHPKKLPQKLFDWKLKKDFQISHNWKYGSVFFYGHKNEPPSFDVSEDDTDSSVSEDDTDSDDDEQSGKKRPKAAASKTPGTNKKAKKTG